MKIAKAIKKSGEVFDGTVYELTPPLNRNKYVVVSALKQAFDTGLSETLIFPSTRGGTIISYKDLNGSQRGICNKEKVLNDLGYTVRGAV